MNRFDLLGCVLVVCTCWSTHARAQAPYFQSGWNHATGTSDAALLDGDAFDALQPAHGNGLLEVHPGGVAGNLLRVSLNGENWASVLHQSMPTNTDEHFYYRFYFRMHPTGATPFGSLHGIQDLEEQDQRTSVVYFGVTDADDAHWRPYVYSYMEQPDGMGRYPDQPGGRFNSDTALNTQQWYRVEGHIHFLSHAAHAPTVFDIRVYSLDGTLVLDSNNFRTNWVDGMYTESNARSLAEYYAAGARFYLRGTNVSWMTGNNGPANATGSGPLYDVSALAFGNSGWIGPVDAGMPAPSSSHSAMPPPSSTPDSASSTTGASSGSSSGSALSSSNGDSAGGTTACACAAVPVVGPALGWVGLVMLVPIVRRRRVTSSFVVVTAGAWHAVQ